MDETPHKDREHAILGASSSDRWIQCPGSIRLAERMGAVSTSSIYADEGTAAHELAHICLLQNRDAIEFTDRRMPIGIDVDEEMAEGVQIYLDECRKYTGPGWEALTEKKFNLRKLNPPAPMFGTCDFTALNRAERKLVVIDLKFGKGVMVNAEGNPQLRYYGLGALLGLPGVSIDEITLTIVQPRTFRGKKIKSVKTDIIELMEWSEELLAAARRTEDEDAPLLAGDHCRFCPCSGRCTEEANANFRAAQLEFDDAADLGMGTLPLAIPSLRTLTPEQMAEINLRAPAIQEFLKAVEKASVGAIQSGIPIPGWKVVVGNKRRTWRDSEEASAVLVRSLGLPAGDVFKSTLRTPKQVEAVLRKQLKGKGYTPEQIDGYVEEFLLDMIYTPVGAPELAPDSDPRPALGVRGEEFDTIPAPDPENLKP